MTWKRGKRKYAAILAEVPALCLRGRGPKNPRSIGWGHWNTVLIVE